MQERSIYYSLGQTELPAGASRRVAGMALSAIKEMQALAEGLEDCVKLSQGMASLGTPEFIREAVVKALQTDENIGKYTPSLGLPELRIEIARFLREFRGVPDVSPEQNLLVTAGCMEALAAGVSSVVDPGDEVILFSPSYSSHIEHILFAEGVPVFVPLQEGDSGWSIDLLAFRKSITPRTKAVVLCSPGNPTGTVFPEADLRALAAATIEHDLYIFSDEAYSSLVYGDAPCFSLSAIPEIKDRLVAAYSFSKMFCMTGWRIGFAYASESLIQQILKVHDAFAICAPAVSQCAALAALRETRGADGLGDRSVAYLKKVLFARRELICQRLARLPELFSFHRPQGGYYIFPKFCLQDVSSIDLALKLLYEARVASVPGLAFGPEGEGHLRFLFGADEDAINQAFDRIEIWWAEQDLRSLQAEPRRVLC